MPPRPVPYFFYGSKSMRYQPDPLNSSTFDPSIFKLVVRRPTPTPLYKTPTETSPFNPKVFGPILWTILHSTAAQLDPSPLIDAHDSIIQLLTNAIPAVIPCSKCRDHYEEMTAQERPDVLFNSIQKDQLQIALSWYLLNIHNKVNARKGKPIFPESGLRVYSNVDIPAEMRTYRRMLQPAIDQRKLNAPDVKQFQTLIDSLIYTL
jgi:hypothetical protein